MDDDDGVFGSTRAADSAVSKRERDDDEDSSGESRNVKVALDDDDKGAGKRWTPEQDEALRKAVDEFGQRNWKSIATRVPGRNHAQCLQRWNKVLKPGLVKGHWSYEEDSILERMVLQGCHSWSEVAASIPGRTAKQCRERWRNHLDPSINKAPFTPEEDLRIQQAYEHLGNRWTQIAELLPGRTEDAVKTRWKALNPNQKTNAKPGRPRLMPGLVVNKARSTGPPNPEDLAVASMNPAPMSSPTHGGYVEYHQQQQDMQGGPAMGQMSMNPNMNPNMPEPLLEPGHEEGTEEAAKDAAILKELLRSHSSLRSSMRGRSSLLSIGSTTGLNSLSDMSPEELLASGELDELFRAVSLLNEEHGGRLSQLSQTSQRLSELSRNRESLSRAISSMDRHDRHIFQGLIDGLRTSNPDGSFIGQDGQYGHDPNMMHSLDFHNRAQMQNGMGNGDQAIVAAVEDSEDIDDLLTSGLMQPIRKGRRLPH